MFEYNVSPTSYIVDPHSLHTTSASTWCPLSFISFHSRSIVIAFLSSLSRSSSLSLSPLVDNPFRILRNAMRIAQSMRCAFADFPFSFFFPFSVQFVFGFRIVCAQRNGKINITLVDGDGHAHTSYCISMRSKEFRFEKCQCVCCLSVISLHFPFPCQSPSRPYIVHTVVARST